NLPSELDVIREHKDELPDHLRDLLTQDRPLDFRPVEPWNPFSPEPAPPLRHTWVKAVGTLADDPLHHQAVLAYASDYGILGTALMPHGRTVRDRDVMAATLDHSIWFHRPFRMDEWLLYAKDSPISSGGRGFSRGAFYTQSGDLVASVAQEGVLRVGRPGKQGNGRS
ncbi:MAG: acyl-CoA thioesterase II, partial [Longimicrobiales bacterium]